MAARAKEHLHQLIEALPEDELPTARRFLEFLRARATDPVAKAFLDAPVDDEPLTPEDEAAIAEARAAVARGDVQPWEVVRAELLAQD